MSRGKSDLKILAFDGICETPAIPLLAEAWVYMLKKGTCPRTTIANWDHKAVVALRGGKPIGVITYTHEHWRKIVWICVSYVVPSARRSGIYRRLLKRVRFEARKLGAIRIEGGHGVSNREMLAAAKAVGRHQIFVTTAIDL